LQTVGQKDAKYIDDMLSFAKDTWFEPAGVIFDKYHSIDHRVNKVEATQLPRNASAILLHGGYLNNLRNFLLEYEMVDAIKESRANVIMGASAGGMNMGANFVDDHVEPFVLHEGLGLDNMAFIPHSKKSVEELMADEETQEYLKYMPSNLDVYAGCEESILRIESDNIAVVGDVFLISNGKIQKL